MEETKKTLWSDYKKVSDQIENLKPTDEKYELLLEERDKIRNELIKLEQANLDVDLKKLQIEAENKREKVRNGITIGTFAVTTCVSIWTVVKTFRFDQDSTVTSTLGRTSITNVVSKMFKR